MIQLESIILYCLKQLDSERTIYSIYHLLNGKKSSQTIQDAHLFKLKRFFGILEPFTRESFDQVIFRMEEQQLIYNSGEQRYAIAPLGELFLDNNPLLKQLNGWEYHQVTSPFWRRLSFLVQVVSNLVYKESNYIPIQKDNEIYLWLKSLLKQIRLSKAEIGGKLFSELVEILNQTEEIDPSILVFRLTGYRQIGLTPLQTAQKLSMERFDYHLVFNNILHYMICCISEEQVRFPLLANLLEGLIKQHELTQSSRKTWQLLSQGHSLEKITQLRQLKKSTIEDHLVEIALHVEDFSIDGYVDKKLQEWILQISKNMASRQLKLIKDQVQEASYFQIRLVLAKYGG